MNDKEAREQRQLLAALDNVKESYELLKFSFDREVCEDLLEWLRISQLEIEAWLALADTRPRLQ